jgi:hypothetical protein
MSVWAHLLHLVQSGRAEVQGEGLDAAWRLSAEAEAGR